MAEWSNAAVSPAGGGSAFGGKTYIMPCVYILYSQVAKKFYVGSSRENDSGMRLIAHNAGRTKSTKTGRPWMVVVEENYMNYTEARRRENFLKSGVGRKWIKENFKERCQSG